MAEAVETHADTTDVEMKTEVASQVENTGKEDSTAADNGTISSDTNNTTTNISSKYTEEERNKRKEYFNNLNKTRRFARDKHRRNLVKQLGTNPKSRRSSEMILSENMSDEDKKMLAYYKVRLSALRSENELLHKRLAYLVNENMRVLQVKYFIHLFS